VRSPLIALAAFYALPSQIEAQDLCAGLKQAVAHAETNFKALKTSNKPPALFSDSKSVFTARSVYPGGTDCWVEDGSSAHYSCTLAVNMPPAQMIAAYHADVAAAEKCFAGISAKKRGDTAKPRSNGAFTMWNISPTVLVTLDLTLDRNGRTEGTKRAVLVQRRKPPKAS